MCVGYSHVCTFILVHYNGANWWLHGGEVWRHGGAISKSSFWGQLHSGIQPLASYGLQDTGAAGNPGSLELWLGKTRLFSSLVHGPERTFPVAAVTNWDTPRILNHYLSPSWRPRVSEKGCGTSRQSLCSFTSEYHLHASHRLQTTILWFHGFSVAFSSASPPLKSPGP